MVVDVITVAVSGTQTGGIQARGRLVVVVRVAESTRRGPVALLTLGGAAVGGDRPSIGSG